MKRTLFAFIGGSVIAIFAGFKYDASGAWFDLFGMLAGIGIACFALIDECTRRDSGE